ncbi:MAG: acetyl-CoA decarbonylase/synthase complex subunit delta [Bacillota bacterium]
MVDFEVIREKWPGRVLEMTLGSGPYCVRVGGDMGLPFHHFEAKIPNRPAVALEITDFLDGSWPAPLREYWGGLTEDVARWGEKCADLGADLVALRLASIHPDARGTPPDEAAVTALKVAAAVRVPLVILGCGDAATDAAVLPEVAAALTGRNYLLGPATEDNYRTLTAACLAHGHNVIARTPLDVNLAKQLNILIGEMNLPPERIAMDPSIGPLGYGIEYAYSVIERMRTAALAGDRMLASPVLCMVGEEAWRTREAQAGEDRTRKEPSRLAILWEAVTASVLAVAGASLLVFRHPEAAASFRNQMERLAVE